MTNATVFGSAASTYKKARPGYPGALFDWIAKKAPAHWAVWDCATGSGQAAQSLAQRFRRVFATDISAEQLAEAENAENIQYTVATAEASGLPGGSVDAITVATALHWFDFPRFWPEVQRVLRPSGLFVAWSYGFMETDQEWEESFKEPFLEIIAPFWSEGNALAHRGYPAEEIGFPFEEIPLPPLDYRLTWSIDQLSAFAESWSASIRAREDASLAAQMDALLKRASAGFAGRSFEVRLPLKGIAGFKPGEG